MAANTTGWLAVPTEIRNRILDLVTSPYGLPYSGKVARFATVSQEWQVFFEHRTFHRLVLDDVDTLNQFDDIIRRDNSRLSYIRKVWLRIKLPRYECPDCDSPEDQRTRLWNNGNFEANILCLLRTLKQWDPAIHGTEGLQLMLSASSPSDTEHRFHRCEMRADYPFHYIEDLEDLDRTPSLPGVHRLKRVPLNQGVWHNHCFPPPLHGHIKRLLGAPLHFPEETCCFDKARSRNMYERLPAVPMIKALVIRRQFCREIAVEALSELLNRSFVALKFFHFERMICPMWHQQDHFDQGIEQHLLPSLPQTLRHFSFTQWKPFENNGNLDGLDFLAAVCLFDAQNVNSQTMARLSQRLENFCPPWQMATDDFLGAVIELNKPKTLAPSRLERIILKCSLPTPGKAHEDFERLVVLAAKAAVRLPQLKAFELWATCTDDGCEDCHAYIFRYVVENSQAAITWRSCGEDMKSRALITIRWSEVARQYTDTRECIPCKVEPFTESQMEIWKCDGVCIYQHLRLKDLMFDPLTLALTMREVGESEDTARSDEISMVGFMVHYDTDYP